MVIIMNNKYWKLLLLPSFLGFLVFYIIPFLYSLTYAWQNDAFRKEFCGLQNFQTILKSDYFLLGMKNTLCFTAIAVPLILLISYIIAFLLAFVVRRLRFLQSVVFLPYLLPSITAVMIWQTYLSDVPPFSSLLFLFLWKYTGLNVILLTASFLSVPMEVLDSAQIDGASTLKTMTHILLPNSVPMLLFTGILSFVNSFKIYRESYLMWGNYPDKAVYMIQNYLNNHFEKLNYQNVSTAATLFFLGIFLIVTVLLWCEKKWSDQVW